MLAMTVKLQSKVFKLSETGDEARDKDLAEAECNGRDLGVLSRMETIYVMFKLAVAKIFQKS